MACCPCLSSSKHRVACMNKGHLDLIKPPCAVRPLDLGTIPLACCPCLPRSTHRVLCMTKGRLDRMKLYLWCRWLIRRAPRQWIYCGATRNCTPRHRRSTSASSTRSTPLTKVPYLSAPPFASFRHISHYHGFFQPHLPLLWGGFRAQGCSSIHIS